MGRALRYQEVVGSNHATPILLNTVDSKFISYRLDDLSQVYSIKHL